MLAKRLQIYALTVVCVGALVFVAFFGAWAGASLRPPAERQYANSSEQNPYAKQPDTQPAATLKRQYPNYAEAEANTGSPQGDNQWLNGWGLSDKIAAIASVVAFLQFVALVATVGVMLTTGKRQLRAYIGVDSIDIDSRNLTNANYVPYVPAAGTASPDGLVVNIKNFGITPANKVHVWANWGGMPFGQRLPDDFTFPRQGNANAILRPMWNKPAIFPQQVFEQIIGIDNVIGFIHATNMVVTMFVWGTISYIDIFKTSRETLFCFTFNPQAPAGQRFIPYEAHNEAR